MAELRFASAPPRAELLRCLRLRVDDAAPGLRVVAQEVLGCDAPIDFVGIDADGRAALVLVGESGQDLELVARGLAQRAWLAARLRDWLQLAPDLGLRPELGLGVVLLCPDFGPESRAAAAALGGEAPRLVRYRCVRNGAGVQVLVERPGGEGGREAGTGRGPSPAATETVAAREPEPPALRSRFRTGLTDADLGPTTAPPHDPPPDRGPAFPAGPEW